MTSLRYHLHLLKPKEAADVLGITTTTLARFAREGRIDSAFKTPGGHRRYSLENLRCFQAGRAGVTEEDVRADDMARLYEQGWSIRQVAAKFDTTYPIARRLLRTRTVLRRPGGVPAGQIGLFD
ncbi:helix-turn-helix domain-containing protein [Actinoallomurus sp. CA-142502]|uniref:helix-turn-helix domain-containing protein n=1 Tax=Actinoallomurus sp. CA-142502 TaxID=3239885 RepID=UPI003D926A04